MVEEKLREDAHPSAMLTVLSHCGINRGHDLSLKYNWSQQ